MCEIRESLEYGVCDDEFKSCEVELFAKESSFNISSCAQYITTTKQPETTTAATTATTATTVTTATIATTATAATTGVMPEPGTEARNLAFKESIKKETKSKTQIKSQRKRRSVESSFPVIFTTLIKSDLNPKLVVQAYNANLKELETRDDLPFDLPDEIFNGENPVDVKIDYNVIIDDYTTKSIDDIEIGFMSFFSVGGAILIAITINAFATSIAKGLLMFFGLLCFGKLQKPSVVTGNKFTYNLSIDILCDNFHNARAPWSYTNY